MSNNPTDELQKPIELVKMYLLAASDIILNDINPPAGPDFNYCIEIAKMIQMAHRWSPEAKQAISKKGKHDAKSLKTKTV